MDRTLHIIAVLNFKGGIRMATNMKNHQWHQFIVLKPAKYIFILLLFLASIRVCHAQAGYLRDEISGTPIDSTDKKIIVLIHGWNPDNLTDMYADTNSAWPTLIYDIKQKLNNSDWKLYTFHWEQGSMGANTGPRYTYSIANGFEGVGSAVTAAIYADAQGRRLGTLLNQASPNLRRVQLIAHSAGAWVARAAATNILQSNPYVTVQITLLDPFIPDAIPLQSTGLSTALMGQLASTPGNDRIPLLENYYATDLTTFTPTEQVFAWRSSDINTQVSWGSIYTLTDYYDSHGGPIEFYRDTVYQSIVGNTTPDGLYGIGCPFDFSQVGWLRSLFYTDQLRSPGIAIQPQNQSAANGSSVTLSVTASSSHPLSYQWYHDGQSVSGATSASYSFTLSPSGTGAYVVKISYQDAVGYTFSDPAAVSIVAPAAPAITSVSPASLPTNSAAQLINIYGSNFKPAGDANASTLIFRDPANNPYVRTPVYVSTNQLQYNITVQSAVGTWSVVVTNGGLAASSPQNFTVYAPAANTGSLVVNISPAAAVTAGAQWQVDGTGYNNSGQTVAALAPGSHTVTFKSISGYTSPASFTANVVANQTTTSNATYTAVAATTYTLTLNAVNGSISTSPTASGNIYNSGSVVQLTANANSGYHFTGWSGDASGSVNPTTVNMSGNKNVTANFAAGDPNLATVTVTIKPDAAATAGVTWSVTGDSQLRASGTSLSEAVGSGYTTHLPVTLNLVSGWLGSNGVTSVYVPVTAGTVTNVTLTCVSDTTPGLLTVTLSPPDVVTAGAKWHVNGTTNGNGATVSLPAGTYSVTFDSVSGWSAPANQSVTIQRSQTTVLVGNYTPPAGQPAIYSISPSIASMNGGTLMTINGVNFTAPANVIIGGQTASNITVLSPTQITCLTPASSAYGSTNVVVQTTGGSATNQTGFAYGVANGNKLSFVTATSGSCYAVDVSGSYAFIGEGRSLVAVNVSSPSNPSRAGAVLLPGIVGDIKVWGNYAYVADGEAGLQVVDISTPTAPKICGYNMISNSVAANGITILGGRVYVADINCGLEIFDLSTPTTPSLISVTASTNGLAYSVITKTATNGVFAYVATGNGVQIMDVSNPYSPLLRGYIQIGGWQTYYTAISGNYVYAPAYLQANNTNYELMTINISNPDAPVIAGSLADSVNSAPKYYWIWSVAVANNTLYTLSGFDSCGFSTFNISGSSLVQAGNLPHVTGSGKMVVSGNYAYLASGDTGLKIIAIANTYSPSPSSTFLDGNQMGYDMGIGSSGNTLCVLNNSYLQTFDVTTPASPNIVGQTPSYFNFSYAVGNGKAYVVSNSAISVIDISTSFAPHQVANIPASTVQFIQGMALSGSRLYASGTGPDNRFVVFDVTTPSNPQVLGTKTFTDSFGVGALAVSGNRAAMGGKALRIIDISNISSPVQLGILTNGLASTFNQLAFSPDGNYVYIGQNQNLTVVSITNSSNPIIVTNIPVDLSQTYNQRGMVVRGNELILSTLNGVFVYDISTPASPVKTRAYSMIGCRDICAPSDAANLNNMIYVANGAGGVLALQEQDIQPPNVYITTPVFASIYTNKTSTVALGGSSDDNVGVTAIAWLNDRGGSGAVVAPFDNWYVSGIKLYPGSNNITVNAFDAAGNIGSDVLTVVYPTTNQNQTISFPPIAAHTYGDAPITLNAAASSGLPVTFSVVSGPATLTGSNVLTLSGAGIVTVQASQPGNSSYNPAPSTNVSFSVARANQAITFTPLPNKAAGDAPFALTATASSGLPVNFTILSGPATLNSSNYVTLLGGGTVSVLAWQPGNSNYNAAASVQQYFNVSKIPQTIAFGAMSQQRQGDAAFPIYASASSGLPVIFSILSGPAQLSGNVLTITGAGTVTVRASQSGNDIYAAAANVDQSLTVLPPNNTVGNPQFNVSGFNLTFYGTVGSNYVFQASSNLVNWTSLLNFNCTNNVMNFQDTSATGFARRFYRVEPQ